MMVDRSVSVEPEAEACEEDRTLRRKPWSAPRLRSLKTSAAELGPNFTSTDGIEGHS
jgi:hypothetical protein